MAFTRKNDEAVSPVIGVILMVAVTVILAAVIAMYVFNMAGGMGSSKVVAFTLERTGNNEVTATFHGGKDAATISSVNYTINGGLRSAPWENPYVGNITKITAAKNSRIVLIGTFKDGTEQIVLDKTV